MEANPAATSYSVVIPVYNSETTLRGLVQRIVGVMEGISPRFEIILVDDSSRDGSWQIMKEIHGHEKKTKIIHLLRNFGQHNAILCGLSYASGDCIIIMDDDLQNPPEEIPKLIQKIQEGYWVVYGHYTEKKHPWGERVLSRFFQHLQHAVLGIPEYLQITNFLIIRREVVKNVITMRSSYPFIPALIARSAPISKIADTEVQHEERKYGRSNYTFWKYLQIFLNLIINHSFLPLFFIGLLGFFVSIFAMGYGLFILFNKLLNPLYGVEGWNSLIVGVTFLGGLNLLSIAIVGEYLRRVLMEISYGQPYAIEEIYLDLEE